MGHRCLGRPLKRNGVTDATALLLLFGLLVSVGHLLILWNQTERAQKKERWEINPMFFFVVAVLSHAFGFLVLFVRYRKCQPSQGLVWYLVFLSVAWGMELILRHKPPPL